MMAKELIVSKYDSIKVCILDIMWLVTLCTQCRYLSVAGDYDYETA
jgi:hypothetical protein